MLCLQPLKAISESLLKFRISLTVMNANDIRKAYKFTNRKRHTHLHAGFEIDSCSPPAVSIYVVFKSFLLVKNRVQTSKLF